MVRASHWIWVNCNWKRVLPSVWYDFKGLRLLIRNDDGYVSARPSYR